ncbi:hypothetical protein Y032_0632g884 [Ancylostoma ceylanicum]|uniref:Uncharacterized protein n=1 Tax=Ancylostoma ceylanicum TaxID=53326 RepID=A0A016WJT2_9BILA|nr:hypothetical protein Y032_0632g884 [Ancylostoma ceylanicum]
MFIRNFNYLTYEAIFSPTAPPPLHPPLESTDVNGLRKGLGWKTPHIHALRHTDYLAYIIFAIPLIQSTVMTSAEPLTSCYLALAAQRAAKTALPMKPRPASTGENAENR